jgi:hypothetical protein
MSSQMSSDGRGCRCRYQAVVAHEEIGKLGRRPGERRGPHSEGVEVGHPVPQPETFQRW